MEKCEAESEEISDSKSWSEKEEQWRASVPDGGWGWFVVLGCTFMHFLIGGVNRSYGVVFLQLRQKFHSSAAITAWVGGMATAFRMGLSKCMNLI